MPISDDEPGLTSAQKLSQTVPRFPRAHTSRPGCEPWEQGVRGTQMIHPTREGPRGHASTETPDRMTQRKKGGRRDGG